MTLRTTRALRPDARQDMRAGRNELVLVDSEYGCFELALRPTIPAPEQSTPTREQRDEALALRRTGSTAGPVACGAGYAASGAARARATFA